MWITTKMVIDIPFWVGGELYMDRLMWDWMRNKKEVALHREKIAKSGFMHKESPYTTQM